MTVRLSHLPSLLGARGVLAFLGAFAVALLLAMQPAHAGEVYKKKNWDYAVDGYDVVAFHTQNSAVKGVSAHTTEYLGENWSFSSAENLEAFKADPDKYRPAYGGHCAWAMARGKKAPGNPKFFDVIDGVLYLNVSKGIQKKWRRDIPGFIEQADARWPAIRAKL